MEINGEWEVVLYTWDHMGTDSGGVMTSTTGKVLCLGGMITSSIKDNSHSMREPDLGRYMS